MLKPFHVMIFRVTYLKDIEDEPKLVKLAFEHVKLLFITCGGCLLLTTIVFVTELTIKKLQSIFTNSIL